MGVVDGFSLGRMEPRNHPRPSSSRDVLEANQAQSPTIAAAMAVSSVQQDSLEDEQWEAHVTCRASAFSSKRKEGRGSLMDRGANGGIAGNDVVVIHECDRQVDVTG